MRSISYTLQLHVLIFLFSFTGIFAKLITLSALPMIWGRTLVAFIVLFFYLKAKGTSLSLNSSTFKLLIVGGLCMTLNWISYFHSIKISSISIALSCIPAGAIFTSLLEPIFFKRPFKFYQFALAIVVSICLLSIFFHEAQGNRLAGIGFGVLAALLSSFSGLISTTLVKKNHPAEVINFYEMLIGTSFITFLFGIFNHEFKEILNSGISNWAWLLVLGGFFTAYLRAQAIRLMKEINPYTFQLTLNLEPIYGIFGAYLLFGESEKMNLNSYIAIFVMILSVFINQKLNKTSAVE